MLTRLDYSRDSQALFAHVDACWRDACNGRTMPERKDIGPASLGRALPYVALIDVVPGDPVDFRYRLIGQHLIVNTGQNLTGRRSLELPAVSPAGRPVYGAFKRCFETASPVTLELDVLNMNGTKRPLAMSIWPLGDRSVDCLLVAGVYRD